MNYEARKNRSKMNFSLFLKVIWVAGLLPSGYQEAAKVNFSRVINSGGIFVPPS